MGNPNSTAHDPVAMQKIEGKEKGKRALLILGGNSAERWKEIQKKVNPDILITVNGVNSRISNADYWICAENMTRSQKLAKTGDKRSQQFYQIINRPSAKIRFISHRSWHLVEDKSNAISIRRKSYALDEIPENFSIRKYGDGIWGGHFFNHPEAGAVVMVGTVALHSLHLAGILGCSEVHTIGFDMMFSDPLHHHWYNYPTYQADRFRTEKMFVEWNGIPTQLFWIETVEYIKAVEHRFLDEGMLWKDHSHGLPEAMGLECTK